MRFGFHILRHIVLEMSLKAPPCYGAGDPGEGVQQFADFQTVAIYFKQRNSFPTFLTVFKPYCAYLISFGKSARDPLPLI